MLFDVGWQLTLVLCPPPLAIFTWEFVPLLPSQKTVTISPFISLTNREKHHTSERHTLRFFNLMFFVSFFLAGMKRQSLFGQHKKKKKIMNMSGTALSTIVNYSNPIRLDIQTKGLKLPSWQQSTWVSLLVILHTRLCVCVSFSRFVTHFLKIVRRWRCFHEKNNNKITSLFLLLLLHFDNCSIF